MITLWKFLSLKLLMTAFALLYVYSYRCTRNCWLGLCNGGTAAAAPPPSGLATLPSVGAVP